MPSQLQAEAPVSGWTINGDGTVTDTANKLMWMQAPFGLTWNANGFSGNPVEFSWIDATTQFGKGVYAYDDREQSSFAPEDWDDTDRRHGYTRGRREVFFAKFSNWRLPTAKEWCSIQFNGAMDPCQKLFPDFVFNHAYWTASGKSRLNLLVTKVDSVAWKGWFGRPINDDNVKIEYRVLLVRDVA